MGLYVANPEVRKVHLVNRGYQAIMGGFMVNSTSSVESNDAANRSQWLNKTTLCSVSQCLSAEELAPEL